MATIWQLRRLTRLIRRRVVLTDADQARTVSVAERLVAEHHDPQERLRIFSSFVSDVSSPKGLAMVGLLIHHLLSASDILLDAVPVEKRLDILAAMTTHADQHDFDQITRDLKDGDPV